MILTFIHVDNFMEGFVKELGQEVHNWDLIWLYDKLVLYAQLSKLQPYSFLVDVVFV